MSCVFLVFDYCKETKTRPEKIKSFNRQCSDFYPSNLNPREKKRQTPIKRMVFTSGVFDLYTDELTTEISLFYSGVPDY